MNLNLGRALFACIATLSPLVLALVCLSAAEVSAQSGSGRILLFGSSSVRGSFGRVVAEELGRRGISVVRRGYSAAGLARPDFRDLRDTLGAMPLESTVRAVILYIGGNDAQGIWLRPEERTGDRPSDSWIWWNDDRWMSAYQGRAVALIQSLCARGMQHVIVLPPADVRSTRLQGRLERVRHALRLATEATECGHFVSTAGDVRSLEQAELAGEPLRTPDGVHMTLAGAHRVWQRVRDTVIALARSTNRPLRAHGSQQSLATAVLAAAHEQ
jgi:hypothetical protein